MQQFNAKALLKEWIKVDRLKDTIKGLSVFENQIYEIQRSLPLLQSRFTENERNRRDNTAEKEDIKIEHNRLREALLELIEELPDEAYITLENKDENKKNEPPPSKPFRWRNIFIGLFILTVVYFGWMETRFSKAFSEGETKFYQKDYTGAITAFNKAKDAATSDEEKLYLVYMYLGAAKSKMGNANEAIEDCNKAIRLNARYADSYLRRGDVWLDKHQWRDAINDYTEAIKLHTTNPEIYYNRGRAFYYNGDFQLAIKDFTEAVNFKPDAASLILLARGLAHDTLGHTLEAREDFDASCKKGENQSCEILNKKFKDK